MRPMPPRNHTLRVARASIASVVDHVIDRVRYSLGDVVMLMFEEREFVNRFAEEYRQYQREVPQIIPRFRKAK
jgi:hypothetical protein